MESSGEIGANMAIERAVKYGRNAVISGAQAMVGD